VKPLYLAIVAMLLQQALAYMSTLVLPVVAPLMAAALGLDIALVGAYTAVMYVAAMLSALSCGGFITRYGGLRVSQVSLVLMGVGLLLSLVATVPVLTLSALLIGTGAALSTPSSSEILARYSPPRQAPLIFSIKQTGVPVGGMLAGLLVPAFAIPFGWPGAFVAAAAMCLVLAVLLQPLRAEFDRHRQPGHPLSPGSAWGTVREVLATPAFRTMALASISWVGLQAVYGAFLVAFLSLGLGYDLATAGMVFAAGQFAAIAARIFWGWVAGRFLPPRLVLAGLGIVMAGASVAVALFTGDWPLAALIAVAMLFAGTAISWHGVLLAEVARLAPEGQVGRLTGGVLAFTSTGIMVYPAAFGLILGATGSYAAGFAAAAVPALISGLAMLRRPERTTAPAVSRPS